MSNETNGGTTTAVADKPKRVTKRYGISDKEFAEVWNACDSVAQVAEKLSNEKRGEVPVTFVNSRVNVMRARGWITLKAMGGGGRPAIARDVAQEQAEVRAAQLNIKQDSKEFEDLVAEMRAKIEASLKEREEASAKRKAAKAAKAAAATEPEKQTAAA